MKFKKSYTIAEMEQELEKLDWILENILGNDFEAEAYIFWTQGGRKKFMEKWVEIK